MFPLSRIKNIIKSDSSCGKIPKTSLLYLERIVESFGEKLLELSSTQATGGSRKKLQERDLCFEI